MPYFFVAGFDLIVLTGLLGLAGVTFLMPKFRNLSADLLMGALGAIPGFLLANALFILGLAGLLSLSHKSFENLYGGYDNAAKFGLVGLFLAGLVLFNVAGGVGGFVGGIWIFRRLRPCR